MASNTPSTSRNVRILPPDDDSSDFGSIPSDISDTESYSSESDVDVLAPTWCITTNGLRPITFTKVNKLLVPIPGNKPIDWFNLLVDEVLLQNIVSYTNSYAIETFCGSTLSPNSRINKWKDLTVHELKLFLGLLMHTGTVPLHRLQDYWKKDWLFGLKCFSDTMSRDRFLLILRCIYFQKTSENENNVEKNIRLGKIKNVIDYFNTKMLNCYYPQRELSLDEAMILWRGRLLFRQYIKGKRHKYGIKLYTLTEPHGLIIKFMVYSGATDIFSGKGHTEKVVLYLMKEKLGHGHSLFMDNFYNSFALASKLLHNNTYCTGTLRIDRKHNPVDVKNAKLKRGETIARYGESVMVGKWQDTRPVSYISTEYENEMVTFVNKRGRNKEKPLPIIKYNAFMKGVDRADQMQSYYPFERKTLRWYKKVFVHIIHMLLMNSHKLYCMHIEKMSFYDYRIEVIRSLLKPGAALIPNPPQAEPDVVHTLKKIEERDNRNRLKRKQCRVCTKQGKKIKTTFFCGNCGDDPGLCLGECFRTYHGYN